MKLRIVVLVALCAVTLIVSFPGSRQCHSQSTKASVSQGEQDLFTEINLLRANPQVYASYLEKLRPLFKGKEYRTETLSVTTAEGWSAVEDAIAFLRTAQPVGPLSRSEGLYLTATAHVKDQSKSGNTGHKTANRGGLVEDRVKPFGSWQGGIGENLAYGNESARERVLTWLIDDGVASRGHRKRLMSADYGVAGVACGPHPQYRVMCCVTVAGSFIDATAAKASSSNQNNSNAGKQGARNSNANKSTTTKPRKY